MEELFIPLAAAFYGLFLIPMAILASLLMEALATLVAFATGRHRPGSPDEPIRLDRTDSVRRPVWNFRRLCVWVTILTLVAIACLNLFFEERTLAFASSLYTTASGTTLSFGRAHSNFFLGAFSFRDLKIRRPSLELTLGEADLDLGLLGILTGKRTIERLTLRHVRGNLEKRKSSNPGPKGPPHPLEIRNLNVEDLRLRVSVKSDEPTTRTVSVEIDSFSCPSLSTDSVFFNLLFESKIVGRVEGNPFSFDIRTEPQGSLSVWQGGPVSLAALEVQVPSISRWFESGELRWNMVHRWSPASERIKSDCSLEFAKITLTPPGDANVITRALVRRVQDHLSRAKGVIPVEFPLDLEKRGFYGVVSLEKTGLMASLKETAKKKIMEIVRGHGTKSDPTNDRIPRGFWDRLRGRRGP